MKQIINLSKKNIKENEIGATSIFVLIFMVVLLVFGVAALTTSLAGLKLADKNHNWSKEYYLLEGNAQKQLADIDILLYNAEINARNYILDLSFMDNVSNYVDKSNQKNINIYWNNQNEIVERNIFLEQLIQYVYYHQLFIQIPYLKEENKEISFNDWIESPENINIPQIKFTIQEEKNAYPKNIDVVLNLILPKYKINIGANEEITGVRENEYLQRYEIIKWKEWQKPFTYTDDINFENPSFDNLDFIDEDSSLDTEDNIFNDISEEETDDGVFDDKQE